MSDNEMKMAERIAVLETKMESLDEIKEKLDELLQLRHKGIGAFWLASSLLGTGILGALISFLDWLKQ